MDSIDVVITGIPGAAVDARPEHRPGVPMETVPPRPVGAAHWQEPQRQFDPGFVLRRANLAELTPVFGTAVPPSGISGWMRRAAYRIPEHHSRHWLVLLLADRVDAIEHNPLRLVSLALPLATAVFAATRLRRPESRGWFARARSLFGLVD